MHPTCLTEEGISGRACWGRQGAHKGARVLALSLCRQGDQARLGK